ncbi:hypothetical protein V0U79_04780 [Hyphobacterium sp. HN65]|uniref:Glycerophosphoryl diester phosphodiesterase membrane domain-containing protein n=1 Tax=Hyphobacterium lacteum TaxID=3116575 RepID=A0ABU7LP46_9PROT|nr:hypothetical protein [Hyphobacterium sp. HN65]MEE2525672.1 hypothetical protein [Hyphobacterium sp. HN65]
MTDTPEAAPMPGKPSLDVGNIISSTFNLFFKHFPMFFIVVFVPYLLLELVLNRIVSSAVSAESNDVVGMLVATYASLIPFWIVFILVQAVIVRVAISLRLGQGAQLQAALGAALRGFFPILLLGIAAGIAMGIGFLFFILPGLYIMAMFYVMVPSIVFENAGFGGISRSVSLTDGYRWAILGVVIILGVIIWIITAVVGAVLVGILFTQQDTLANMAAQPFAYPWWYGVVNAVISAATTPISLISVAMIYARLKEIKEGGQVGDLLKVFE